MLILKEKDEENPYSLDGVHWKLIKVFARK